MNRLTTFGGAAVETSEGPVSGRAAQRHRIALLALLSTTRRLYRNRDQLIFLLWPEVDAERGRKLLSDSIYRVNQALGGDVITGTSEDVRLNRNQLGSDVADLEAAVEAQDWLRVAELYAGPFLDGFFLPGAADFDHWMENERAQYARTAAKALEALAVEARDAGRVAVAVDWWQRLSAIAPDDSRVAMELMRALEMAGNRAGALRHARVHCELLRESYGVAPDRAVQELAEQISTRTEAPVRALHTDGATAGFTANAAALSLATTTAPDHRWVTSLATDGAAHHAAEIDAFAFGCSIAVLPFKNLSDSDANAYFADGMSEELMYLLTRTPGMRVASPTSVFAYRDMKLDVREVARRLHVAWILEGSVRRAGGTLRIMAQLTDARSGYQLWSESFDRTANDVFEIQSEIALAIVRRLAPAVAARVGSAMPYAGRRATDAESYDLCLRARFQWHRRTETGIRNAAELFEQVVARDPGYARAWAGLAETYAVMAFHDYLAPDVASPRAESAARRAMQLDPSLASPFAALAHIDTFYHWNWEVAEEGFRRALELEPASSIAHMWYGNLLTARGRFEEAELQMRRAADLDPLSLIAHSATAWVFLMANQNERAIRQCQCALQLDPNYGLAHFWMGLAYEQNGQPLEAIPILERVREPTLGCPQVLLPLARAYVKSGNRKAGQSILDGILERERGGRYVSSYEIARLLYVMGDVPTALTRLERAVEERARSLAFLHIDPLLQQLNGEARFDRLVKLLEKPAVVVESHGDGRTAEQPVHSASRGPARAS